MDNQKSPLVSVCMIAYQVESYIKEAIEGVLMQECDFEIELIISNDNSLDGTEEIVLKLMDEHPNGSWIRYNRQENNIGSTLNYLWCLENAIGDFISICDSDDFWTDPFKLKKQIDFLINHPDFVGSFHNRIRGDIRGNILSPSIREDEKSNLNFKRLILEMPEIPSASVVFRKNRDFKLPEEFKKVVVNGDTFLWAYVLQSGDFYYDDTISPSYYRIHSNGLWSSKSSFEKSKLSIKTYKLMYQAFHEKEVLRRQIFEIRNHLFYYALKEKDLFTFLKYYTGNLLYIFRFPSYLRVFINFHKPFFKKSTL